MNNKAQIKGLLYNAHQVVKYYDKTFETSGQAFSIFHACDIVRNEVVLHSRFIGYLLNPKAGHRQKDKFLKLFFETFDIQESTDGFQVEIEKSIGRVNQETVDGGRIDVFISNPLKKIAFAIEVKIWAEEQKNQLARYSEYIKKITGNETDNTVLYLTLYGEESKHTFKEYKSISFSNDILNWIEKCRIASIDQPLIRETLTQYANAIKSLTHQNIDNHMNDEIINLITQDENSFKAFEALQNMSSAVHANFINSLVSNLRSNQILEDLYEVKVPSKIEIKTDFSICFKRKQSSSPEIHLYWLDKGIIGFGMVGKSDEVTRLNMQKAISKSLNLGKVRPIDDRGNWFWLAEVDELKGHPKLTFESWKLFKDEKLAQNISEWVTIVYEAYQELHEQK